MACSIAGGDIAQVVTVVLRPHVADCQAQVIM